MQLLPLCCVLLAPPALRPRASLLRMVGPSWPADRSPRAPSSDSFSSPPPHPIDTEPPAGTPVLPRVVRGSRKVWSARSESKRRLWSDPVFANTTLAKRARTRALRKSEAGAEAPPPPPKSTASILRSDAMKLFKQDEKAWMRQRLESGKEQRELRGSISHLKHRQQERSELAVRRYRARQRNSEAGRSRRREAFRPEVNESLVGCRLEVMKMCDASNNSRVLWHTGKVLKVSNGSNILRPGAVRATYKPGEAVLVLWDASPHTKPAQPAHESTTRLLKSKWNKEDIGGWRIEPEFLTRNAIK